MVTTQKTSSGCWTCRLRRKKCDNLRPKCGICKSLEIDCHFNSQKLEWMVRGYKQREMSEKIKHQIKQNANRRRDRKQTSTLGAMISNNRSGTLISHFAINTSRNRSGIRCVESHGLSNRKSASTMINSLPEQDTSNANEDNRHTQSSNNVYKEFLRLEPKAQLDSSSPRLRRVLDTIH
jgi:hypothetical protein